MFPVVDTRNATAVADQVRAIRREFFPDADGLLLDRLVDDVSAMFAGQFGDFAPIDLLYHDFHHTLQATLCMAELLGGRQRAREEPPLSARQFDLGIAAVLLHDTGYLKTRSDPDGTGAKYTYAHVLRSCATAASYLPRVGVRLEELDGVLGAIRCTGPAANIHRLVFRNDTDRGIGCCLATADYLSQMAAEDYPEELVYLYNEFEESDDYLQVPREDRVFSSAADLIERTPSFWRDLVEPKLRTEFGGVFRYLAAPYPDGPNPYLAAIERNIACIAGMARPGEATSRHDHSPALGGNR
jgi:hypothetical protein